MAAPLDGLTVLDLATSRGDLAGRMLADLGADVIFIEPPGGAPTRERVGSENQANSEPARVSLAWRVRICDGLTW